MGGGENAFLAVIGRGDCPAAWKWRTLAIPDGLELLQVIRLKGPGISAARVRMGCHRDEDVFALLVVEIFHPQQHPVLHDAELYSSQVPQSGGLFVQYQLTVTEILSRLSKFGVRHSLRKIDNATHGVCYVC